MTGKFITLEEGTRVSIDHIVMYHETGVDSTVFIFDYAPPTTVSASVLDIDRLIARALA